MNRLWACISLTLSLVAGVQPALAQSWVPFQPQWGPFGGVAEAGQSNRALSTRDTVAVEGRHFVRVGPDGQSGTADDERVRFFGVNVAYTAAFPSPQEASQAARTLRTLGFNAVRLHALDVEPTSDVTLHRSTLTEGPYPTLHATGMERLKTFIDALRKEGIYINLNLMVGYQFRPAADGVPSLNDQDVGPGYGSPVHVFYPPIVAKQQQYAERLLQQLGLRNNPVLAQVEIINESSLAATWMDWHASTWEQKIQGAYAIELQAQWMEWVRSKHGSLEAACQAWKTSTCGEADLALLSPSSADQLVHGVADSRWIRLKDLVFRWLDRWWPEAWPRWWLPEPQPLPPKVKDTLAFLVDTDRRFLERMRETIREQTRSNLPVGGGQMNFGAPLSLLAQAGMDFVDTHSYVGHPEFPGVSWSDTDWRFKDRSLSEGQWKDLANLAAYRDWNRPFVVSEFNQPYPATWGHEIVPVMAALAAQQDWDGLYFFDYGVDHGPRATPHNFNLKGDWPKLVQIGMASRLFLGERVKPAPSILLRTWNEEEVWDRSARHRRPDAWEQHLFPQTVTGHPITTQLVGLSQRQSDSTQTAPSTPQALVFEDSEGLIALNTPTDVFLLAKAGTGRAIEMGPLAIAQTSPDESIAVWVQSVGEVPISQAQRLLMALPSPVVGTLPESRPPRPVRVQAYEADPQWQTLEPPALAPAGHVSTPRTARPPLWLKRERRSVTLTHPARGFEVFPLDTSGQRLSALPASAVRSSGGQHTLTVNASAAQTHLWYEWVAKP